MSDVTDPHEPHPEPALTPDQAPAQIPPEMAEAVSHGQTEAVSESEAVTEPVIEGGSPYRPQPAAMRPPVRSRSGTRVLVALGFLLLFAAVGYEYVRGEQLNDRLDGLEQAQGTNKSESDALLRSLKSEVEARTGMRHDIDALQAGKSSSAAASTGTAQAAPDLAPLEARLKDVEQKVASLAAAPKSDATGNPNGGNSTGGNSTAGTSPSASTTDLGPIEARLNGLEQKVASLASEPKADATGSSPTASSPTSSSAAGTSSSATPPTGAMPGATTPASTAPSTSVPSTGTPATTTPAAPTVDLSPIEARLKALEDKPAPAPAAPPAPAPDVALLTRVNTIADQLDGLDKKLAEAQSQAEAAQASAQAAQSRATVALTRAAATVALDAGKPLGTIPHAPPALTRFATEAPPTEASLRLSFDAAAQKAQDASVPPTAGKKFGARMLTRIESLVTVSQGDHVLVGPPAATILASAHEKLQAGDLAGAVTTLDGLDPAAKAAMASWTDRAQSLLDARAALQSDQLGAP